MLEDGEGGEGKQIMASEMPGSPPARSGGSLSLHEGGEYAGVYLHGGYHRVGEETYCKDLYRLDLGALGCLVLWAVCVRVCASSGAGLGAEVEREVERERL